MSRLASRAFLATLAALCLFGIIGCGGGGGGGGNNGGTITVSVSPQNPTLTVGGSQTFAASVSGTTNQAVNWTVVGTNSGAITTSGTYTAPATPGSYTVVATSQADTSKSGSTTIVVTAAPVVSVGISPASPTLGPGATQQFTATVSGTTNQAVNWTVQEGSSGGSVTTGGLYTAPTTTGTYHVVATSQADPTKSATATVTVNSTTVNITIAPATVSLLPNATQTFTAAVTNATDTGVTWSIQEGTTGGTVTQNGFYKAPAAAGVYHVVATSNADTTKTAIATVTVTSTPSVTVSVLPQTVTLGVGGVQSFSANVSGTTNTSVLWSIQEGTTGGTIASDGTYTAPGTAGTFHVIATSVADPTKTGSATITVTTTPTVSVAISPTTATTTLNGTLSFTATVSGSSNNGITWSIQEGVVGGTVSATGSYIAGSTPGIFRVVATSVADPTKKATSLVTVQAGSGTVIIQ